jgi:hypothetical protein
MKRYVFTTVAITTCFCFFSSFPYHQVHAQRRIIAPVIFPKMFEFNFLGTSLGIKIKPMPRRLKTLEGKTIYVIDQGCMDSDYLLREMIVWFEKELPKTRFVFKRLDLSKGSDTQSLLAEIKEKGDAMIIGPGIQSQCAKASIAFCVNVEHDIGKPTVFIIDCELGNKSKEIALTEGMPNLRFVLIRYQPHLENEQLRKWIIEGICPNSGKPVMQEIINSLIKPLTSEEKKGV